MKKDLSIQLAKDVLKIEAESIAGLIEKLNENFTRAVDTIYRSTGRVIVTGIGKSGLIGKKIVATLTSTGTQAIFLHPVEGVHGDLGIVTKRDVVLAISNSGETHELNVIVSSVREIGATLIALTGNTTSTLARACDLVIDVGVEREACPFGLAPTSSSTAALAMGDALAVALIEKRKFNEADFYKFHPGGNLGARLRARVREVMIGSDKTPKVFTGDSTIRAIEEMDINNKGFVLITDRGNTLLGIFTDGDLRRLVKRGLIALNAPIDEIMTRTPKTIDENASLAATIETMQKDEITTLVVVNGKKKLQGYIHLHDILGRGGTLKIAMP
ncbi:MAG TPA: KpsF/GutQ family sugar-phosphate isomerase [Syntrophales bacterium]|jgi:arabinose-5-phosphate isomerase|nr:KpsF/GutQ family sugar-phosphate isomerase [Syntrophales bacterium]HON22540.1 KpsF/GutQ family sugar-phosphate isomerase [Syntrophales bacterium]HOU77150.1 KpsF/GutQ family sugar-phosphate isomerase [Syntrophales bacterium]HPC33051.1 KpsF/GutQ family sugar-phosphate isomerase [Syntrophales bacterium]HQG33679.1 KpsF/GutQ family sugar-phosphate isomerase [Syntrophales bacterium]